MVGTIPKTHQLDFFQTPLVNFIDMDHELVHLAHKINWNLVEHDFAGYFSENGRPGVLYARWWDYCFSRACII